MLIFKQDIVSLCLLFVFYIIIIQHCKYVNIVDIILTNISKRSLKMFEFTKLCNDYENLSVAERGVILTVKSAKILAKLKLSGIDGVDPVSTLASFIIGSVVADGKINEQEYLLIYPALVKVFGDDFDFASVKRAFESDKEGKKAIKKYTEELLSVLASEDDEFKSDVVTLCLCVVTVDGKVSLKEKRYIRKLCDA